MINSLEEFKDWPIKEKIFLCSEKYKKHELLNLLKYNKSSIHRRQKILKSQLEMNEIISKYLKNDIKERYEILKKLKETDL